jgi:hypothetical protein
LPRRSARWATMAHGRVSGLILAEAPIPGRPRFTGATPVPGHESVV